MSFNDRKKSDKTLSLNENVATGRQHKISAANANDTDLVKIMKLAVAFAIIRSRPPKRSAMDHAEHLLSLYMMAQHKWREKCYKAQAEILNLKQQLILSNSSFTTQNSGDESASDSQSLFPTPPSSSEAIPEHFPSNIKTLHRDVIFLQSVISLHRAGDSVYSQSSQDSILSALPLTLSDISRATMDHSLKCVRDAVSDSTRPLASSLLSQAISSVIQVLEKVSPDNWTQRYQRTFQDVMSQLLHRFLAIDRFQQAENIKQGRLLQLIPCFYQTTSLNLLQGATDVFIHHLTDFCSHLRQLQENAVTCSPVLIENMHDVLCALETCVSHNRKTLSSTEGHVLCAQLQDRLEICLMHLTQIYPLLAHAVWKVTSSLELCLTHQD